MEPLRESVLCDAEQFGSPLLLRDTFIHFYIITINSPLLYRVGVTLGYIFQNESIGCPKNPFQHNFWTSSIEINKHTVGLLVLKEDDCWYLVGEISLFTPKYLIRGEVEVEMCGGYLYWIRDCLVFGIGNVYFYILLPNVLNART